MVRDVIIPPPCTEAPGTVSRDMVRHDRKKPHGSPKTSKSLRILAGCAAIGLIVWLLSLVPYDILREERFRLFGEKHTSGVVLALETNDSAAPENRFVIRYKFVDQDGYARTATAPLPEDIWSLYRPGNRIDVFYPSAKPELSRVPDEVEPPFQVWLRSVLD